MWGVGDYDENLEDSDSVKLSAGSRCSTSSEGWRSGYFYPPREDSRVGRCVKYYSTKYLLAGLFFEMRERRSMENNAMLFII